tara:strand:+ start:1311 stop:1574 length:264 start_codon:yes stop_codon:yes gene_type:complete
MASRYASWVITLTWPQVTEFVPENLRKWAAVGLILVSLLPLFLFSISHPPVFDITAPHDSVDHECRRSDYANSFPNLNENAKWVTIE